MRDFGPKKCVLLVELWAWILCAEAILAIQHLLGCCILGKTSQKRSASVTKIKQPRAWMSLKRASVAPQSKYCCVFIFKLIIFSVLFCFFLCCFNNYCVFTNRHIYHISIGNDYQTLINSWPKLKRDFFAPLITCSCHH